VIFKVWVNSDRLKNKNQIGDQKNLIPIPFHLNI